MSGRLGAAIGLALLLTVSCAPHQSDSQHAVTPAQPVRTAAVREIAFSTTRELSGTIAASRQAVVGAAAAGRVVAVYVRTGERVSAGQPLARIDDAAYRAAYAQTSDSAEAAVAEIGRAEAQAAAAQARSNLAGATARRMESLYRQGAISAQQNDEAQADLASSRAALAQAQAAIRAAAAMRAQADAAIAAASVPLQDAIVRAPFGGVILSRAVDPGAVVAAGGAITTVEDDARLELDVSVPDESAAAVRAGMPAWVRVDALGGKPVQARVRAVMASPDPALRSATVKIDVAETPHLLAGMFARVRIAGEVHRARAIPAAALVRRGGQDGVFAIDGTRASFVPVLAGATQNGWIETASLPSNVRRVAIDGVAGLTDGATVALER